MGGRGWVGDLRINTGRNQKYKRAREGEKSKVQKGGDPVRKIGKEKRTLQPRRMTKERRKEGRKKGRKEGFRASTGSTDHLPHNKMQKRGRPITFRGLRLIREVEDSTLFGFSLSKP